ncbi:MAG: DNA-binding response regulator [Phycisphaerales bacterium]|nr:MAG: DNA-binding response regulator [Phycisphaerales bacterium]
MTRPIRLLLADNHALVRASLANWLNGHEGLDVIGEAGDADAAVELALRLKPDMVLMDIDMPGLLCFDAARTIGQRCPETRVVFVSGYTHDRYIEGALKSGVAGYITKGEEPEVMAEALFRIASGETWYSNEIQQRIVIDREGPRLAVTNGDRSLPLTPRELEVLRYVARGMSKKEIAATMHISVKTVDNHSTSLMTKLDIHDRVELARFAIRNGLIEP